MLSTSQECNTWLLLDEMTINLGQNWATLEETSEATGGSPHHHLLTVFFAVSMLPEYWTFACLGHSSSPTALESASEYLNFVTTRIPRSEPSRFVDLIVQSFLALHSSDVVSCHHFLTVANVSTLLMLLGPFQGNFQVA